MLWFVVGTLGPNEITHLVAGGMRHLVNNALEQWFWPNNIAFMSDSNSDSGFHSSWDGSCDGEPLALAPLVRHELDCGSKRWHAMHLYPPLVGSAIGKFSYGASIASGAFGV